MLALRARVGHPRAAPMDTSYYLGRERLLSDGHDRGWRAGGRSCSSFMSRNSRSATEFFGMPPNRVVELGAQIEF